MNLIKDYIIFGKMINWILAIVLKFANQGHNIESANVTARMAIILLKFIINNIHKRLNNKIAHYFPLLNQKGTAPWNSIFSIILKRGGSLAFNFQLNDSLRIVYKFKCSKLPAFHPKNFHTSASRFGNFSLKNSHITVIILIAIK